jgi:hypothetical protein
VDFFIQKNSFVDESYERFEVRKDGLLIHRKKLTEKENRFNALTKTRLATDTQRLNSGFLDYVCKVYVDPTWRRVPLWMYLDGNRWSECEKWAANSEMVLSLDDFLNGFVTFIERLIGKTGIMDFGEMSASKKERHTLNPRKKEHTLTSLAGKKRATSSVKDTDGALYDSVVVESCKRQAVQCKEFRSDCKSETSGDTDNSDEWLNTFVRSLDEEEKRNCDGPVMWLSSSADHNDGLESETDSFDSFVAALSQESDVFNSLSTEDSFDWEANVDDLI